MANHIRNSMFDPYVPPPRPTPWDGSSATPEEGGGGDVEHIDTDLVRLIVKLRSSPRGMSFFELRRTLDRDARTLHRTVKRAVEAGRVRRTGAHAAVRYFAVD